MDLTILVLWIVSAFFCRYIAKNNNRDPLIWFILGLFFSLIALIIISILPKIEAPPQKPRQYFPEKD